MASKAPTPNPGRIGKAIKAIRQERQLSQQDFARLCSLTGAYVSLIENDKALPSLVTLGIICRELQVPKYVLWLKAEMEENMTDPEQMRFVRELKKTLDAPIRELYPAYSELDA